MIKPGHEKSDVNTRRIWWIAGFFVVFSLLTQVVLIAFLQYLKRNPAFPRNPVSALTRERVGPPPPRLQVHPELELQAYRDEENRLLHTYGWIDRPGGVVRIPIDRAMDLLVERAKQKGSP